MKANYEEGFSIDVKYASIPSLIIVIAWHLQSEEKVEFYALIYPQMAEVADRMGWAWRRDQKWVTTSPSLKLKQELEKYKVPHHSWRERLLALGVKKEGQ